MLLVGLGFYGLLEGAELTNETIVNEMLHDAKWQLKNGGASPTGPELSLATKRMIEIQVQLWHKIKY